MQKIFPEHKRLRINFSCQYYRFIFQINTFFCSPLHHVLCVLYISRASRKSRFLTTAIVLFSWLQGNLCLSLNEKWSWQGHLFSFTKAKMKNFHRALNRKDVATCFGLSNMCWASINSINRLSEKLFLPRNYGNKQHINNILKLFSLLLQ